MRGSAFVVFEVLLWMAAALVLGMVIGWLIRGWRSEKKLRAAVEQAHTEELAERGELSTRLAVAEARVAEFGAAAPKPGELGSGDEEGRDPAPPSDAGEPDPTPAADEEAAEDAAVFADEDGDEPTEDRAAGEP